MNSIQSTVTRTQSTSNTCTVTIPVGSKVAALRGPKAGEPGLVIGSGFNPGGTVLTVQYADCTKQYFASACEVLEFARENVRASRCGRFLLIREYCPQTARPGHLIIDGADYAYVEVPNHSPEVVSMFRLVKLHDKKASPEGHIVTILRNADDCTCADFIYRSGPEGKPCKHLQAVRELGLVPAPTSFEVVIPEGVEDPFAGFGSSI